MLGPLVLLAFLSFVSGFGLEHGGLFERLVNFKLPEGLVPETEAPAHLGLYVTGLVVASIMLSWRLYGRNDFRLAESLKSRFSILFSVLENRYGMDALFLGLVAFCDRVAKFAFWFDSSVIDQFFVDSWGLVTTLLAELSALVDNIFVDRTVDGFGGLSMDAGVLLRSLVTHGQAQEYLMYIAVAVSLFTILILSR
jgi:NADH:ubiquinone oxidoreductase subunit 5 (subunit L)/multisubunit Na+/H+ antiporter MnhA subunit